MTKAEALVELMNKYWGIATRELIYNEIEQYYPDAKKAKDRKAWLRWVLYRDLWKRFKRVSDWTFAVIDFDKRLLLDEDDKWNYETSDQVTEKDIITSIRIGQSKFRKILLKKLHSCPFTWVNDPKILIASHIKPWSLSNNHERTDPSNWFIFTPTYDRLFDLWLITFSFWKELLVSCHLTDNNINKLWLKNGNVIELLPLQWREEYLEFHQTKIFRS